MNDREKTCRPFVRKARRLMPVLLGLVLILSALAGCGGGAKESSAAGGAKESSAAGGAEGGSTAGGSNAGTNSEESDAKESGAEESDAKESDAQESGAQENGAGGTQQAQIGDDELQAVFFDVGKGDCILLTMGGEHVLLDAGYAETSAQITKELEERGVESLEAMIITHYDKDHVGGAAEIAQEIPVDTFYLPDYIGEAEKCGDLLQLIEQKDLNSIRVTSTEEISLGKAQIDIDPALIAYDTQLENDNDASLIVKIFYEEDEWLLPGDIEKDAIGVWLESNTQTFDILKMPHHGAKGGGTKKLIENVDPDIAVITDSAQDEASEKVLKQLDKEEVTVYRSSDDGTITITGNGSGEYEVVTGK